MPTSAWHVTPTRNLKRISEEGLVPRLGSRARDCRETKASVFLFPTVADMDVALNSWLGEQFGESTRLAVLQVAVADDVRATSEVGYEMAVDVVIPPAGITVMHRDIMSVTDVFEALGLERPEAEAGSSLTM